MSVAIVNEQTTPSMPPEFAEKPGSEHGFPEIFPKNPQNRG
jgi:hypothetical protein